MADGYCTTDDVRRVLQEAEFTAALSTDSKQIVVDAITGISTWLERAARRHWYVSGGITEDDENVVPTASKTRNDEHDIPTHGAFVDGASEQEYRYGRNSDALLESGPLRRRRYDQWARRKKAEIRIATGDVYAFEPPIDATIPAYTRIELARRDVTAVNELHVINETGGYDDWVASNDYDGGVGNQHRGEDYWIRINNKGGSEGFSELYLDVHAMDDDLASFANAVYVDIDYGSDSLPQDVRRGVAFLAASDLVVDDEFVASLPDNGNLTNVESKSQRWERRGLQQLNYQLVDTVERP